jgi:replicative DNA helicase
MHQKIRSVNVEKHVLAGFIKHPQSYHDVAHFINEQDFTNGHKTIFGVIKNQIIHNQPLDPVILSEKIKNLGISFNKPDFNIFDYIESLTFLKISQKSLLEACKELKTVTIRREIFETSSQIQDAMVNAGDQSPDKIISLADKMYNDKISAYDLDVKPEDLFANIEQMIEERANAPVDELGYVTPYKNFNQMYGGLRPGELYAWVSRPKHGKSTILNDIATKATIINPKMRALVLDTEMQTNVMKFRIASSITGIPMWYLETGNFKNNKELLARWNSKKTELSLIQGRVNHMQVAGKPVEEIESIIQRWYLSEVGRGNPAIVVYDYIKLTGEAGNGNKQEYQLIGDKVDSLKNLSVRLNIPLLTACQLNRSAENGTDDSSAIAQSDRLQWFAAYVGIFRRKTLEEQAEDGANYGTHKMIELAARYQGKHAHGHSDLVKVREGNQVKYKKNFISFEVNNFNVTEKATLQDIVDSKNGIKVDVFDRDYKEEDGGDDNLL